MTLSQIKKPLIILAIASLVFTTLIFVSGLVLFILAISKKIELSIGAAIAIYAVALYSLPFSIVISVFSIVSITKQRTVTSFVKTVKVLKWFIVFNSFAFLLSFKLERAIEKVKELKLKDYPIFSLSQIRALMYKNLYEKIREQTNE